MALTEAENQADTEKHIRSRRMCRKVYQEDKKSVLVAAIVEVEPYSLNMVEWALAADFRICLVFPIQAENPGSCLDNRASCLVDSWNRNCMDYLESLVLADSDMGEQVKKPDFRTCSVFPMTAVSRKGVLDSKDSDWSDLRKLVLWNRNRQGLT